MNALASFALLYVFIGIGFAAGIEFVAERLPWIARELDETGFPPTVRQVLTVLLWPVVVIGKIVGWL